MKHGIEVSQKRCKADFILRNAQVADVFNLRWRLADIVVANGRIIAIDQQHEFEAHVIEDAGGKYVIPGLIDAHIHIESSMLTPSEFNRIMVPHGITSIVTDPHEIANVSGTKGLQFMLDDAKNAEMDIYYMLPSSVPGTSFEHAGAVLKAEDLASFVGHEAVLGLAEVMDFPAVLNGDAAMLAKIELAQQAGMVIDGHCAGLTSEQIRGYRAAGIQTDHECVTAEEARDRIEQGMYVLIREGSAAKNLKALLPAVTSANARRFAFCTDDKHLDELMEQGSINYAVSLAIKEGMEPLQAIQLASLNAAECYRLKDKGALASGFIADFVLLEDLVTMKAATVWKSGVKVAENGKMLSEPLAKIKIPSSITQSVNIPNVTPHDLAISFTQGNRANVIEIMPDQLTTKRIACTVDVVEGQFVPSVENDFLKLAVIERHHQLGTKGLAIVHGFGLKRGAVATTVAHDSHNAIVVGTNDEDMIVALETLQQMQGGLVVVADGKVLGDFALPVAGLMTEMQADLAADALHKVHEALHTIHPALHFHFFLTLSFLSLPVIPEIKLTDTGLFDVTAFQHISVEISD